MIYLVQSWASAESRFGRAVAKELAAITNNTLVLGGSHDVSLLRDLQELCGTAEVFKTSTTLTRDARGGPPGSSRAVSQDREPVLRAHEISRLETTTGQALLLAGNLPPVLVELPPLTEHPDWPTIQQEIHTIRTHADTTRAAALAEPNEPADPPPNPWDVLSARAEVDCWARSGGARRRWLR
ncbi:TraM recognition domain-containing protein [Streptomyces profundus]|uniref:TraM recognition domain-containing protein n=1 Tax=Streptomyces profundus TaxID=2867410 RepID=UPI002240F8E4|nr:TraM recognition domain-containing protein [Streptomyces sp. MA3_2.13]